MKNIWVFIESYNGKARKVSLELLNKGLEIARSCGEDLVAVIIGSETEKLQKDAAAYGAESILVVDAPEYKGFDPASYSNAFKSLIEKHSPRAVLFGSTYNGMALSGRLTAALDLGIAIDCTDITLDENKVIGWVRPTFDGKLMAEIKSIGDGTQIGAIRTGVFRKLDNPDYEKIVPITKEDIPAGEIRTKILGLVQKLEEDLGTNLEEADYIVSGGKGLGSEEGFKLIQELAAALGGVVGASRMAVDLGWITKDHQVGLTGKTVRPKIYIACGISGAPPHVAGIKEAELVIAINTDPNAPIFKVANYGIVGDLYDALPVLIEEVKKRRAM